MRQVLAELHSLITELEDQGLVAEASTLQDVFVKIAAEDDDSAFQADFDAMMGKYGAAKILSALADAMGDDDMGGDDEDTDTASFAFGDEPGVDDAKANRMKMYQDITEDYASAANRKDGTAQDLFMQMNEELKSNGFPTMFPGAFNGLRQQLASPDYFAKMNAELGGPNTSAPGRLSPNE
jgi:hypothetical protein